MVTTTPGPLSGRNAPAWLSLSRRQAVMPAIVAALLILLALISQDGSLLGTPDAGQVANSWVDVILIMAGGGAIAALVIQRRGGGGTLTFCLFAAVTLLTALSIAWSVAPDQTWEESGRAVAYLAAFGIALVLGRANRGQRGSHGAVLALTLAALGLCVWALAVKALDLNLYGQREYGPLLAPFAYWNATGVIGAMALPGCIYLAARRGGRRLIRGLAVAGIGIGATVILLTYSRSALAAAIVAVVLPLFFLRTRRRAVVMLGLGILGAVPAWLFAGANHNISADLQYSLYGATSATPVHRAGAGLVLGAIMLVVAVLTTLAGAALSGYLDDHPQPAQRLRRFDLGLRGAVAAVPVLIVIWLLVNHRGPTGEISHVWSSLTSVPKGGSIGGGTNRVVNLNNSRAIYWREALAVGAHHLLAGAGVGTFSPAYLAYHQALLSYSGQAITNHAHSYVLETFAALGLIGILLNLGLFVAWCTNTVSALRHAASDHASRWALVAIVIAFGVSSALDWTWFVPGVAIPGLLAAGWIAGVSGRPRSTDAPLPAAGPKRPAAEPPVPSVPTRRRPLSARPGAIIALTVVVVLTLAVAWESLAPMRATQSINASLNAQEVGSPAALSDARSAVSDDPLSAKALDRLAAVYGVEGQTGREDAELVQATHVQPDNPQPFVALGSYLVCHAHAFLAAETPLERSLMLDLTDSFQQTTLMAAAQSAKPQVACPSA